jgi:hypothetical protein
MCKWSAQPGVNYLPGEISINLIGTQGYYIGIIVLSAENSSFHRMD